MNFEDASTSLDLCSTLDQAKVEERTIERCFSFISLEAKRNEAKKSLEAFKAFLNSAKLRLNPGFVLCCMHVSPLILI